MKTKNILRAFLTAVFVLGTVAMNAQTKIYVHKTNGTAIEYNIADLDSISFTAPATPAVDYSQLVINEVNGVSGQKWVEIYNKGENSVSLDGVTIKYSNNNGSSFSTQYTFDATDVISGYGYYSNGTALGSLSANNATVIVTINTPAPANEVIDTYSKPLDINSGFEMIKNVSHARIPDGTGDWYYLVGNSTGTRNATNGTSTAGYIKFGDEAAAADDYVPSVDYSQLVINEVNGVSGQKWVEIYNKGENSVSLNGVTIKYSNNNGSSFSTQYTFGAADVVPGYGYFSNGTALGSLSANNATVIVTINTPTPANEVIDTYSKPLDINSGFEMIKNVSHARIPDGTGDWYYLVGDSNGTRNATNGTSTAGFIKFGDEATAADF